MEEQELSLEHYQQVNILSVEESRAVQEVQAQLIIAKKFPRDEIEARSKIRKACERKSLAEVSQYVYPRGGTSITGPSIKLAEVLGRCWKNLNYGLQEVTQSDGSSDVIAFAWDLENNVKVTRQFKAAHSRKARGQIVSLTDPRDIYELVANQGQRRVRSCILELIPGDIVEEAVEICEKTLQGAYEEPLSDRIVKMVEAFDKLGVPQQALEQRLGHPMKSTIEQELANLRKIYTGLKDGIAKREDFFNIGQKREGKPLGDVSEQSTEYEVTDLSKGGENHAGISSRNNDPPPPNGQEETPKGYPCPHCDHISPSERGLKKHITQSHPLQSEGAKKHFGTDSDEIKITGEKLKGMECSDCHKEIIPGKTSYAEDREGVIKCAECADKAQTTNTEKDDPGPQVEIVERDLDPQVKAQCEEFDSIMTEHLDTMRPDYKTPLQMSNLAKSFWTFVDEDAHRMSVDITKYKSLAVEEQRCAKIFDRFTSWVRTGE